MHGEPDRERHERSRHRPAPRRCSKNSFGAALSRSKISTTQLGTTVRPLFFSFPSRLPHPGQTAPASQPTWRPQNVPCDMIDPDVVHTECVFSRNGGGTFGRVRHERERARDLEKFSCGEALRHAGSFPGFDKPPRSGTESDPSRDGGCLRHGGCG